ncbi:fad nad-binding domain-containing protein [Diplodia corticola]|uniref:Fad nad-binding domain-containing protein n=1 Tax=Diplodia corticola TaxID=236234 RepID=A0A1J9RMF6_9PEZI|nr:fad nad-binding domain-containing protein [Diplodia corticola]OJD29100.1 fad nad-binding domain-containing protein [Diplodia corticola]
MAPSSRNDDPSPRADNPIHNPRPIHIIAVGAGPSGLLLAYKLQRSFTNYTLTIYEKNADVAGTWFENRYPGCACDVPSHSYTYSFWPHRYDGAGGGGPSRVYAGSDEIRRYFTGFADHWGLGRFVECGREVVGARWDGSSWGVEVRGGGGVVERDVCDVLVDATGFLNAWKWPRVEGLERWMGRLIHTADWPEDFDYRGKNVALIGNGSSAIQVLPAIQPHVKSLTTFIRSPTWIAPPIGSSGQREYTEEEKEAFRTQPGALLAHRKEIEDGMNRYFAVFQKNSPEQVTFRAALATSMRQALSPRPDLAAALIPSWSVGCRRFTPGPGYLSALQAANVHVVHPTSSSSSPNNNNNNNDADVTAISASGRGLVTASGAVHPGPFDALVCATGFDTSFAPRFPVVNARTGRDLRREWGEGNNDARGYLATAAAGFPNYLTVFGPSSPTGNGPVLGAMEAQVDYVCRVLDRYQTENWRAFAPKRGAVEEFNEFVDGFMGRMVWSEDCRSWYKKRGAGGRVTGLWPGSMLHFVEALREPRWEDWEIAYEGNRFAWLGNGFSRTEVDPEADLSYYVREEDDGEYASREMRRKVLTNRKKEKKGEEQAKPARARL